MVGVLGNPRALSPFYKQTYGRKPNDDVTVYSTHKIVPSSSYTLHPHRCSDRNTNPSKAGIIYLPLSIKEKYISDKLSSLWSMTRLVQEVNKVP
jgi:hypothetical protein